ncbi:hypothetical protein niasHS_003162 [Heterodera schachtii]|uniref:Uncharacterized protein n=1 Tax=Heterodera schachtii TaxID=97005 RepID=A0ABD2K9W8_HETSC
MELAANDGTGELHKFVCELEEQHLFLDKLFPISSKQLVHQLTVKENEENREKKVANFLSEKWAIIKQEKPQLANIFTLLQTSFNTLKGDFGNVNALKVLKKQIVEAAFLLADHVQISQDQILPLNRQNGLNMMKELAKLWVNSREFCGKCTVDENYGNKNENHGQNDEDDHDGNDDDNYDRSRQWQRKILQLILSAVDDGNIEALKMATNEGDDQSRQQRVRRRRKKRDLSNRAIFIIVAIVILCLLFCLVYSFCLRPLCADCCGGGTAVAPAKSGSASSGNKSAKKSGVKSGGASSSGSNTNGGNLNKPWFSLGFKTNDNYPIWHPMRYFPDK